MTILLLAILAQDLEVDVVDPAAHKIVLLAGGFSKGGGEHEYFAGSVVLFNLLQQTAGVKPVLAREWPRNEAIFEGAKAVVFYMDGIGKQPTHQADKRAKLEALAAKGVGIVHLHQVIDYPKDSGEKVLPLLGGVWVPKVGTRGHWVHAFDSFPDHPVTRGVAPFKIDDGFIYKNTFMPSGVTPLLRASPPKGPALKGMEDVVAWTYDRPAGGRTFVFTGCHLHASWALEGMRRFVTNGILWSAGLEVPAGGAPVALDPEDLKKNLDVKPAAARK